MKALLLLLTASTVFAQGASLQRGDALKRREYQTYSTQTFFIDTTGNDANACTASGTSACLTWAGVKAKLPRFLQNPVTVTFAAGTYTGTIDLLNLSVSALLTIQGTLINATVATGSATGTWSAAGISSVTGESVLTDATQSWTVNDLRGKFISITGFANGIPIISNTATTINVGYPFFTPVASGSAYTVRVPDATISTGASVGLSLGGVLGNADSNATGRVVIQNLNILGTGQSMTGNLNVRFNLVNVRVINSGASGTGLVLTAFQGFTLSDSYFETNNSSPFANQLTAYSSVTFAGYFRSLVSGGLVVSGITTNWSNTALTLEQTGVGSSILPVFLLQFTSRMSSPFSGGRAIIIKCAAGSGSTGVKFVAGTATSTLPTSFGRSLASTAQFQNINISNCLEGVEVTGTNAALSIENLTTTSVVSPSIVQQGAVLRYINLPTSTGATNEILLDGNGYSYSALNALSPKTIVDLTSLSKVTLQ